MLTMLLLGTRLRYVHASAVDHLWGTSFLCCTPYDCGVLQKPAKKQKVEKEPKTPKAKKAAEDTDENGEPKLKRPMSAYFIFCEDKRKEAKEANADKPLTAADLSGMWKALSDEDKEPFNAKAAELKAEYDAKRPPTKTEQKQNAKADAPKKARSAYFIFASEMRPSILVEFPGIKVTEVAKIIGAKWKELSAEDKKKWEEMAKAEKEAIAAGGERPDITAAGSKRKSTEDESEEAEEEADEGEDKEKAEEAAGEEKDEPVAASQAADDKEMADDKEEEAAE